MNVQNAGIAGRSSAYKQILDEAWEQHLAPRAPDAPTVISLFAGCGGSSLGYSMAGYKELLAVEWAGPPAAMFRLNFPHVLLRQEDITQVCAQECMQQAGLEAGELAVLDGSPPCQGFSTAGKRNLHDVRNQLFQQYVRFLEVLQPRAFVMENVAGLVKGKMKLVFAEIMQALKRLGYTVSARCLDAQYFLVPQQRARMIFLGLHPSVQGPLTHPAALRMPLTVREALQEVPPDPDAFHVGRHTSIWCVMQHVRPGGHDPQHHSHMKLAWYRPAPTMTHGGGVGHYHYWHPQEHRTLTFHELRRLMSFPDAFQLCGTQQSRWECLGNAVPPLFMRAIAQHVRSLLEVA